MYVCVCVYVTGKKNGGSGGDRINITANNNGGGSGVRECVRAVLNERHKLAEGSSQGTGDSGR